MKLLCKCGNIEGLKPDKLTEKFEFKDCKDVTLILVCNNCKEPIYV